MQKQKLGYRISPDMERFASRPYRVLKIDEAYYPRVPYGNEYGSRTKAKQKCHDCGTKVGGIHYYGCDMEKCPKCNGQMLSCGHEAKELIKEAVLYDKAGFVTPNDLTYR